MNESMDRVLADWLREGPETGPREGLERALAATRRVGQKPGWALPERWIPMQLTMARTPSLRPILAIVMVALLTLALFPATRLFEPLLMALIGILIGLIVILMYMPIFDLAGSIR